MFHIANLTKKYDARGVLSNLDMTLTETKKEGIEVHNLKEALQMFEGEDISISITYKHEVAPSDSEGE